MTREWFYQFMGQELGPLTAVELKAKVVSGQIQPDTMIRKGPQGKWVYSSNVKGLFAPAPAPEPPPKPAAPRPISHANLLAAGAANAPNVAAAPANYQSIQMEDSDADSPAVEFYDFVGFREAISPALHDAVKQFVSNRGITICQLNRRALATFINRPELASDLAITSIVALPQAANEKSNADGRFPLGDSEKGEVATFRFTLFNSGSTAFHATGASFLPESVEERTYDTVGQTPLSQIDHTAHRTIKLGKLVAGKSVHIDLDVTVPPHSPYDLFIWFFNDHKPGLTKVRGQLLIGHDRDLIMSEFFTITLHGDTPSPPTSHF